MAHATQLTPRSASCTRERRGLALPSAMFGLVVLSILGAAIYSVSSIESRSVKNRESAQRALFLAEAGAAHALHVIRDTLAARGSNDLLRGSDITRNTSDDGWLTGYGMSSGTQIPTTGVAGTYGRYYVRILDDPAETDGDSLTDVNYRVLMRCEGVTTDGARSTVDVIVRGYVKLPAIAVNGSLALGGNSDIVGACAGAHANGNINISGSSITSNGPISATGTISGGAPQMEDGTPIPPRPNQIPMEIPILTYPEFCAQPDYILRANGYVVRRATNDSLLATGGAQYGWRRTSASPVNWTRTGTAVPGTFCAEGNVIISTGVGTAALPFSMTVIAQGSIDLSGNSFLTPAHPDGVLLVAMGDLRLSGTANSLNPNFDGLLYAGAQCDGSGTPDYGGQLICQNGANPAGSLALAAANSISGNPIFSYGCGGLMGGNRRVISWTQRMQ